MHPQGKTCGYPNCQKQLSYYDRGVAEGINNKIMSIKRRARGYRNIKIFNKAIFFHFDGRDLFLLLP